ncbi:MAG: hypothetical protein C0467_16685 [Planctomycetaceae bacterium]|nr:hypothetical protein [Planctomycetaceae bacterium]
MRFERVGKWKWLRRIAGSVFVSLTIYFLWVLTERGLDRLQGNRDFAATVAETDAMDPDWRWDDLNAKRPRPPVGQNSAELIPKIKAAVPTDWNKLWAELDSRLPELSPNVRMYSADLAKAKSSFDSSPQPLRLARTLKDLPHGHRDYTLALNVFDTLLPDVQHTREVALILKWDACVAADESDAARASDALAAGLNASRSIGDEPFLISQLVRIATRIIMIRSVERTLAQISQPESLASLRLPGLQHALTEDTSVPMLLYGIRGERATFDILAGRLDDGTVSLENLGGPSAERDSFNVRLGFWHLRGRLPSDRAFCLSWFNAAVAAAEKPVHEQPAAFENFAALEVGKSILLRFLPAVDKVAAAHWRCVAEGHCAVVGIACERFRLKNGRWPETLAELGPEFLASIPLDPFDGHKLRYAKCADGVVVHSVGPKPDPRRPPKFRPGLPDSIEIGFRLWNPEARRQPPPAEPKVQSVP